MSEVLDQSQRAFVEAPVGNIRLLAPAGCGKTRSLLYRCKHLASLTPERKTRFLIVTFTRAARDELHKRLTDERQFASIRYSIELSTLNAWGWQSFKKRGDKLIEGKGIFGLMKFRLKEVWQKYDNIEKALKNNSVAVPMMTVVDAFKAMGFDHIRHSNFEAFSDHVDELCRQQLGWWVWQEFDQLEESKVLEAKLTQDFLRSNTHVSTRDKCIVYDAFFGFWRDASEYMIDKRLFTFEDQKYVAYLNEREKLEKQVIPSDVGHYDHILVDEFQDINPLELTLIKTIAKRHDATITIAGDDDQAIFEWKGTTPEFILNPKDHFGASFQTRTLGINYRSPSNIVDHSQKLIKNNKTHIKKSIVSAGLVEGAKIEIHETSALPDPLEYVRSLIAESIEQGISPSLVGIIGRNRAQLIPYQIYFVEKEIPFSAPDTLNIILSPEFEKIIDVLKIKTKAYDDQPTGQIVDEIRILCNLVYRTPLSNAQRESILDRMRESSPRSLNTAIDILAECHKCDTPWRKVHVMAERIRKVVDTNTVSETLRCMSEFRGLKADPKKSIDKIFFVAPPFPQLAEYAEKYADDYDKFINAIERAKQKLVKLPPFEDVEASKKLWEHPVHMMTSHRAKGKEFNTVVLLDVLKGIHPNIKAKTAAELEAERRVFYVAFTRAKKRVSILWNRSHPQWPISPYIEELGLSEYEDCQQQHR